MESNVTFRYFGWNFGIKAVLRRLYDNCNVCGVSTKPQAKIHKGQIEWLEPW